MHRTTSSSSLGRATSIVLALLFAGIPLLAQTSGVQIADLYRLRSVGDVHLSPDGRTVIYGVVNNDRPETPYSQLWTLDAATGKSTRLGGERFTGSDPHFSPEGARIAYLGRVDDQYGVIVADAGGANATFIAPVEETNHVLPSSGERLTWSPDGRRIAFISAMPGPETEDANGDPMVITRYLYKPHAGEGLTRFNDNRRLHIFVVDVASKSVRQLTDGNYYEHSIDWSSRGDEIAFISNREPDPDRFFNYDVFAVRVDDGAIRRITNTKSAEYYPKWSPDGQRIAFAGTKRSLTSSETTMEDTHVWVMNKDGSSRVELGNGIDNRQGAPEWSADGRHLYFTVQDRGNVRLYRLPASGGKPEIVVNERGTVGRWAVAGNGALAYGFTTPRGPSELYVRNGSTSSARRLTNLNEAVLPERSVADVEAFTFKSFDGTEIEAFLTKPLSMQAAGRGKHPMIVMIHGGPHGQQGPGFNAKAQIYAAQGWAALMVNYRGSTGYGQQLADAIFKDQNGGEAKDVLAGVDAALAKYGWIDADRLGIEGGSYGGQLTNWIVTQTNRFKAAVPAASISNLVSFNYTAYYHDYLAVEFGAFPHENGIIDLLWERSPIRYTNKVKTPTLLIHGENDNDVPIAEAEQFFIALKDVGVDTVMVRYPREGHGIRETKHVADSIERSIAWYKKYFGAASTSTAVR
jgi:dipeptidyl aminopeptidase/acylaminoacyl peptidase